MAGSYRSFIGLRYVMSKRRNRFISFISLLAALGIALGVVVLITVLSVVNGFERALTEHLVGMEAEAVVIGYDGALVHWQDVAALAHQHEDITGVSPYVESAGMVTFKEQVKGVMARGILPQTEAQVSFLAEKMIAGELAALAPGEYGIILGADLLARLQAQPGDTVTLVAPAARITPAGILPRLKRFTVVGVYDTDMYEFDSAIVFTHLDDAARFFRTGGATGLRLKTTDARRASRISREAFRDVPAHLSERLGVIDWTQRHVNYFHSIQMTKKMMFVILVLIVAVAAFNIIATLMMMVTDKQADIAVLRTLGAAPADIMQIFIIQGAALGGAGALLGVAGGVALALNIDTIVATLEHYLQVQFLSPEVYFISELPSDLYWTDVAVIAGAAFACALLATLYPAWRAARTRPAEALRYE
ncbi:MAG: lipoprotein-releasing ABC transporter permease subunit [Gammaproteobacteria bacterium]|nr:lipoprotein-releasing ABC transporter permease subunit [Gammaproteobacteria bacterium]MCY4281580.1 lipoprotein-releasing ABC transporter permease subunit [Gammaproteobacteria bacterium]MCY4338847.1 lipoprotein-releasing ABC transporter permease subunit [Gammaproteobacteria bacterium]